MLQRGLGNVQERLLLIPGLNGSINTSPINARPLSIFLIGLVFSVQPKEPAVVLQGGPHKNIPSFQRIIHSLS